MNDINVVFLNLNQYYMVEHPELNQFVDEAIASTTEVGTCLEWKYSFAKCIKEDIPQLKEKSVGFLLEFYSKDILSYNVVERKSDEMIVYMFFKDAVSLSSCLSRPGLGYYEGEISGEYKSYMREHKLQIFQLIFGQPQEFLGTPDRQVVFNIVYILLTFPIFLYVDSFTWKIVLLVGLVTIIRLCEKHFRKKNK